MTTRRHVDREQLVWVADIAMRSVLDRIESGLPPNIGWADRYDLLAGVDHSPLELTSYERGALETCGMILATTANQLTGAGLGIVDALAIARADGRGFGEACERLVRVAWANNGRDFVKAQQGAGCSDLWPDTRRHAEAFADRVLTEPPPAAQAATGQPPTGQPPTEQPPTEQSPTEQPPTEQPPTEQPPTEQSPTEQSPTERGRLINTVNRLLADIFAHGLGQGADRQWPGTAGQGYVKGTPAHPDWRAKMTANRTIVSWSLEFTSNHPLIRGYRVIAIVMGTVAKPKPPGEAETPAEPENVEVTGYRLLLDCRRDVANLGGDELACSTTVTIPPYLAWALLSFRQTEVAYALANGVWAIRQASRETPAGN